MPDECTIISFKESFYERLKDTELGASWFFKDDIQSILLQATPELEYAHNVMVQKHKDRLFSQLAIESIVLEILRGTFDKLGQNMDKDVSLPSIKKDHLKTIERAKEYLNQHLATDISLFALADHCHLSPFHFSRVFKNHTHQAPHQYLQGMRLKLAELTLKNTKLPVTEVAFTSGFSSLDYFSAAFKHKYKASPSLYRARLQG